MFGFTFSETTSGERHITYPS